MKAVKIHIYLNTVILPRRHLDDTDIGHDIIETMIGDNEEVKECELVGRGEPVYEEFQQTGAEARAARSEVGLLGGSARTRSRKVPDMVKYRCRIITMEVVEGVVGSDAIEQEALPPGEIVDAELVQEN